tara:strand:- start:5758 stop:6177 length:420 start_codon:yes stop_codon:yes gene_type:complete
MKDFIRYIGSIFNKKNIDAEPPEEWPTNSPSGSITFSWDSESGDFQVLTNVEDYSESSSEVLGMLLSYVSEGHMRGFLLESLKLWASETEDEGESEHFYMDAIRIWNMMNELDAESNSSESPLISPIDVFRLSRRDNSA